MRGSLLRPLKTIQHPLRLQTPQNTPPRKHFLVHQSPLPPNPIRLHFPFCHQVKEYDNQQSLKKMTCLTSEKNGTSLIVPRGPFPHFTHISPMKIGFYKIVSQLPHLANDVKNTFNNWKKGTNNCKMNSDKPRLGLSKSKNISILLFYNN